MASISGRERVSADYDPTDCDVDFSDVFGGPPRRFSKTGSADSGGDGDVTVGFGEKPVFGDESMVGGRKQRHTSHDFYDDIFRVDGSSPSCSHSCSSAPGSRVMSPSRPSSDNTLSSAKFSLPVRLAITDSVVFPSASPSRSSPSLSANPPRFNQTTQSLGFLSGDAHLSYRPSPLSHQTSVDTTESPKKAAMLEEKPGFAKDSKGLAIRIDNTQIHFSIYKWASKEVPLVMSARKRSPFGPKVKIERSLSATEKDGNDILVAENQNVNTLDYQPLSFRRSSGSIVHSKSTDSQICHDLAWELSKSLSNSSTLQSADKHAQVDINIHGLVEPRESPRSAEKCFNLKEESKAPNPKSLENTRKCFMNTVGSLSEEMKEGDENAAKGEKERKIIEKEKPSLDDYLPSRKVNKTKADSFREPKTHSHRGDEGEGSKVKDFVKIFNHESSSKINKKTECESQSWRWKDTSFTFEGNIDIINTTKTNEEEYVSNVNWETTTEASEMADGDSFLLGKLHFDVSSSSTEYPTQIPELKPITGSVRQHAPNIKATLEDDILSKTLIQDMNIQAKVEDKDELKSYENKVRKWAKGKEGNIRSLLSTLQYVLWPDSGWKPVPLVDIIEANAVRKAYQRALLRLHPDKLQQKGAAPHQKFIAEKVFDVLQEAWDHFNSLTTI